MEQDDPELEGVSYLKCSSCYKQEKVIDNGNDIQANGLAAPYKDMISTLLQNKCKSCEKYTCSTCLDECNVCSHKNCKLCLDYVCDRDSGDQYYICSNCKY